MYKLTSSDNPLAEVVEHILDFRAAREASTNKRRFDQEALDAAAVQHHYAAGTFSDYADSNFRYLKATGLVQSAGRGIAIVPAKRVFVEQFVVDTRVPDSDRSFLIGLCNGAALPTDNRDAALIVLDDLVEQLNRRGVPFAIGERRVDTPADIDIIRHEIEQRLAELNEDEYAQRQAQQWNEIVAFMDVLINPFRQQTAEDDEPITIPRTERPAYFEWVLWRAFLAIDSLVNRPYEARQFNVDQDFLPVGTAPGNRPDLIFEFDDFVVVVEVTLTESSRQEANEGEPVRRHVAEYAELYEGNKDVYGLFIAINIDSNTAHTFKYGDWYKRDESKINLHIVPIRLQDFRDLFTIFDGKPNLPHHLRDVIRNCRVEANNDAPVWKTKIREQILRKINELSMIN